MALPGQAALLLDDRVQRRIYILRHAGCVAADIDARAILQPRPELRRLFDILSCT